MKLKTKLEKIVATILMVSFLISPFAYYTPAYAVAGKDVPIDTMFNWHNIQSQLKNFVLDGIAWKVAKIMVQQITASTVQWINSGFQGSPAFLTNPEGFFMNVGDQITGMFIDKTGILGGLCSPFNVDIRLAIALDQAGYNMDRPYTCTLSSVINNVENSTVNGRSINGFMNGDFSQGGWQGFIAIGNPGNNPGRVYLQAQSDLAQQIGAKQGKYQQQLIQGGGFLSWEDCKQVSAAQVQDTAIGTSQLNSQYGVQSYSNNSLGFLTNSGTTPVGTKNSLPSKSMLASQGITKSPTGSYNQCETKTPGSVINSQLSKQLGSGIDQLNLANSINQIVDALLAQLVTQILQKGLAGGSQKSSGSTQSYIQQLSAEANNPNQYTQDAQNIQGSFAPYITIQQQTVDTYNQIITLFDNTKSAMQADVICFQNLSAKMTAANQVNNYGYNNSSYNPLMYNGIIDQINTSISGLTNVWMQYKAKYNQTSSDLEIYQKKSSDAGNISGGSDLQSSSQSLQSFSSAQIPVIQQDNQTAKNDLEVAKTQVQQYQVQEQQYHDQCRLAGGN